MGVCTDESACTEFDAAEVTHDGNRCVRHAARLDRFEDRAARRAARLTVIARTLAVGTHPEHHRVWDVTRLIVFLFYALQPCAHRFLILRMNRIGEKA